MSQISKPYPHGSRWRCKGKTPDGWRWCPSADSPEGAIAIAHKDSETVDAPQESGEEPGMRQNPANLSHIPDRRLDSGEEPGYSPNREGSGAPGVRLAGPYPGDGGWRYRLVTSAGREWAPMARTQGEALKQAERMAATSARQGSITIRDTLDIYLQSKRAAGVRQVTLDGTRDAVEKYCRSILDLPVGQLTPYRGQQQYDKLQVGTSVSTHRAYLSRTKSWARWVVSKGWLRASPLEGIQGVGRRKRGKVQLSWDEGNRLGATCLAEGSEAGTAVLMALLMGLRASEALSRVVRDIDRGGVYLRVDDNEQVAFRLKTESSRRPVKIPELLRPLFAQLAQGKEPTDPLFPGTVSGRRCRQYLHVECGRLCRKAGVPLVCPHSLRGWMASSAVAAGELPEVVARGIGHASAQMTLAHYIAPGIAEAAQLARGQAAFAASQSAPLLS